MSMFILSYAYQPPKCSGYRRPAVACFIFIVGIASVEKNMKITEGSLHLAHDIWLHLAAFLVDTIAITYVSDYIADARLLKWGKNITQLIILRDYVNNCPRAANSHVLFTFYTISSVYSVVQHGSGHVYPVFLCVSWMEDHYILFSLVGIRRSIKVWIYLLAVIIS